MTHHVAVWEVRQLLHQQPVLVSQGGHGQDPDGQEHGNLVHGLHNRHTTAMDMDGSQLDQLAACSPDLILTTGLSFSFTVTNFCTRRSALCCDMKALMQKLAARYVHCDMGDLPALSRTREKLHESP